MTHHSNSSSVKTSKNQALAIALAAQDVGNGDMLGYLALSSKDEVGTIQGNQLTYTPNANFVT